MSTLQQVKTLLQEALKALEELQAQAKRKPKGRTRLPPGVKSTTRAAQIKEAKVVAGLEHWLAQRSFYHQDREVLIPIMRKYRIARLTYSNARKLVWVVSKEAPQYTDRLVAALNKDNLLK